MDDWKCAKGIPWTAHEPNARADTLIFIVQRDYVCEHKMVMVEADYGASELKPLKPLKKTRSPFETGGCRCNEEVPKDTPSDEGIFKCSECGSRLGSPHEKKCAYK